MFVGSEKKLIDNLKLAEQVSFLPQPISLVRWLKRFMMILKKLVRPMKMKS